jgi:hypothetical protein
MFVRELEEYAVKLAERAALAFYPVAASDPGAGFRWLADVCGEASKIDRSFPGFYADFSAALDARKPA